MSDNTQNPQVPGNGSDPNAQGPAIPPPPAFPGAPSDAPAFPGAAQPELPQPQFGAQQPPQFGAQQPPAPEQPQYGQPQQPQYGAPQTQFSATDQPMYGQPQQPQQPVTTGFEQNPFGGSANPYGSDAQPTEQYTQPYGAPYGQDQYGQPYGGGAGGPQYPGGPQYGQGGGEPPKQGLPVWLWVVMGVAVLAIIGLVIGLIVAFSGNKDDGGDGGGDAGPKPTVTESTDGGGDEGTKDPEPEKTDDGGKAPSGKKFGLDDTWETGEVEFVLKDGSKWDGSDGFFSNDRCHIFTLEFPVFGDVDDERKATEKLLPPVGESEDILGDKQVAEDAGTIWLEDANGNQVEFLVRIVETTSEDYDLVMNDLKFARVSADAEIQITGTYSCYDDTDLKATMDVIAENIVMKEAD